VLLRVFIISGASSSTRRRPSSALLGRYHGGLDQRQAEDRIGCRNGKAMLHAFGWFRGTVDISKSSRCTSAAPSCLCLLQARRRWVKGVRLATCPAVPASSRGEPSNCPSYRSLAATKARGQSTSLGRCGRGPALRVVLAAVVAISFFTTTICYRIRTSLSLLLSCPIPSDTIIP
jgi:hypothetical protein